MKILVVDDDGGFVHGEIPADVFIDKRQDGLKLKIPGRSLRPWGVFRAEQLFPPKYKDPAVFPSQERQRKKRAEAPASAHMSVKIRSVRCQERLGLLLQGGVYLPGAGCLHLSRAVSPTCRS